MEFILVYFIDDYPENGGGNEVEFFNTAEELDKRVSEVMPSHEIIAAGQLDKYTYKAVEYITKIERQ